jgi:BAI1-associated protein 3
VVNEYFSLRDAKMMALTGYHSWFKTSIHKWLQIVHDKSCDRIRRAVDMDQVRRRFMEVSIKIAFP